MLLPVYYRPTYKIQDARGHMPTHNKNSFLGSHSTANHKQMKTCTHSYTLAPHTRTNTLTQIPIGSNKYILLKNDTKTHTHTPKQTLNFQQHHIYTLSQTHTVKLQHKHPHITLALTSINHSHTYTHARTNIYSNTHTEIHRCTSYYQNTLTAAQQHKLSPAPKKQPLNFFSQTFFIFSHFLYLPQFLNLDDNRHLRLFFSEPLKCFFFLFSTLRKNFQKRTRPGLFKPPASWPTLLTSPKNLAET